jgi:hypothetical protein
MMIVRVVSRVREIFDLLDTKSNRTWCYPLPNVRDYEFEISLGKTPSIFTERWGVGAALVLKH